MKVWLGLGSNLDQPQAQIDQAIKSLRLSPNITILKSSSNYLTAPIGGVEQEDFVNAVVLIETSLSALECLDLCQEIEQDQHRKRPVHWGPRTLDIDILLFGEQQIKTERLTVPHPRMLERGFVLKPLAELAPALIVPDSDETIACLAKKNTDTVQKI